LRSDNTDNIDDSGLYSCISCGYINLLTILESVGGIDVLIDRFALNDYQVDDLLVMPVKETDARYYYSFINMFPDAEGCYR
jgi:hypothetical protein